jgi:SAM-dependent methyltransferase
MAITATHYRLFKSLPLPQGGSLLEIGEANWYGDIHPFDLCELTDDVDKLRDVNCDDLFAVAKLFYKLAFAPSRIVSIDQGGTASAIRHDLNYPVPHVPGPLDDEFDVIINHGTAEHIFNIAQVLMTMHDLCADGGLMVHDAPFTGWIDHGFYCLNPTLFYDLAAANCYEVVKVAIHTVEGQQIIPLECRDHVSKLAAAGTLPPNSMLFVALRKLADRPFKIPTQGVYAGALSAAGKQAWERLR